MTDFAQALEKVLFDRLDGQVTLADVYQHVPQDKPPPVVIIGDLQADQAGAKGDDFQAFEFEIVSIVAATARKPLLALQEQVKGALINWTPPEESGVRFSDVMHLNTSGELMPDGEHYFGVQRWRVFAETA